MVTIDAVLTEPDERKTVGELVAAKTSQGERTDRVVTELPRMGEQRSDLSKFDKSTQSDRAKDNGISRYQQIKLDYLFANDTPRFAQVKAGGLSISRAYDESRDKVKTPLGKALSACDKLTPEERRIVWQMLGSNISA